MGQMAGQSGCLRWNSLSCVVKRNSSLERFTPPERLHSGEASSNSHPGGERETAINCSVFKCAGKSWTRIYLPHLAQSSRFWLELRRKVAERFQKSSCSCLCCVAQKMVARSMLSSGSASIHSTRHLYLRERAPKPSWAMYS